MWNFAFQELNIQVTTVYVADMWRYECSLLLLEGRENLFLGIN